MDEELKPKCPKVAFNAELGCRTSAFLQCWREAKSLLLWYCLGNGSGHRRDVTSCLMCLFCPRRSIYTLFIAYEVNTLVQELESTSIFRAGIYSRIPD